MRHEKSLESTIAYATRMAETGDNVVYSIFVVMFTFYFIFFNKSDARRFILNQPRMIDILVFISLIGCGCWIFMIWRIGDIELEALGSIDNIEHLRIIAEESIYLRIVTVILTWIIFIAALILAKCSWKQHEPAGPDWPACLLGWEWYPSNKQR